MRIMATRCGFSVDASPNTTITPDGQYVVSGSGDGTLNAWSISTGSKVASWDSNIGVASCLKWAPRRAAASKGVLTFWIPKDANSTATSFER
ncbi:putative transcription factor WD40-like family [Helianthus annuus]|nr:putative transcription factor WD40-like family [Helianthus annuus]